MKRDVRMMVAAVLLLGGITISAQAAQQPSPEAQELARARKELASKAAQTKGAAQQGYDLERRRIDGLIDRLQRGQSVSPSEIDSELQRSRSVP